MVIDSHHESDKILKRWTPAVLGSIDFSNDTVRRGHSKTELCTLQFHY